MDLSKLNPWNWFKHEDGAKSAESIPLKRDEYQSVTPARREVGTVGDIWQLHREMDRLFDEAFRGFGLPSRALASTRAPLNEALFRPSLNVASDDKQYTVTLEAPGLVQDDIKLELKGQTLFIQGEKRVEKEDKDKHYYRIERRYGQFQRVLDVPEDVDLDKIEAKMKHGVLTINLPRVAEMTHNGHRHIPIQS
ncbi:MAG: Hsp20/alpha crystallin family protein [Thiomicrospira sp.]|jgi:HSP20 family protein